MTAATETLGTRLEISECAECTAHLQQAALRLSARAFRGWRAAAEAPSAPARHSSASVVLGSAWAGRAFESHGHGHQRP